MAFDLVALATFYVEGSVLSALGTKLNKTRTVSALLELQPGNEGCRAHAKGRVGRDLVGLGGSKEGSRGCFVGNSPIIPS